MPSSAARSCPLCPRIVGLFLPVLAHSWHNGVWSSGAFGRVWVADLPVRRQAARPTYLRSGGDSNSNPHIAFGRATVVSVVVKLSSCTLTANSVFTRHRGAWASCARPFCLPRQFED